MNKGSKHLRVHATVSGSNLVEKRKLVSTGGQNRVQGAGNESLSRSFGGTSCGRDLGGKVKNETGGGTPLWKKNATENLIHLRRISTAKKSA